MKIDNFLSQHFSWIFKQKQGGDVKKKKEWWSICVDLSFFCSMDTIQDTEVSKEICRFLSQFFSISYVCLLQKIWLWLLKSIDRTTTTMMTIQLSEKRKKLHHFFGLVIIYWSFINHDNDNDNKKSLKLDQFLFIGTNEYNQLATNGYNESFCFKFFFFAFCHLKSN